MYICLLLSVGCTSGYSATIRARPPNDIDETVIQELVKQARFRGFDPVREHQRDLSSPGDVTLASAYKKGLSESGRDSVTFDIVYTQRGSASPHLDLFIDNRAGGMNPKAKAEIDGIADTCYDLLVRMWGADYVTIARGQTRASIMH